MSKTSQRIRRAKPKRARKFVARNTAPLALVELCPELTLTELARRLDVTLSMMSKVFNGERLPGRELARRIAFECRVTTDRLMFVLDKVRKHKGYPVDDVSSRFTPEHSPAA